MAGRLELVLGVLTSLLGVAGSVLVTGVLDQPDRERVAPLLASIAVLCAMVGLGGYVQAARNHPLGLMVVTAATVLLLGITALSALSFGIFLAPAAVLALATMVAGWTALAARWYDGSSGPAA